MATWPDPRSVVVSMAFGATLADASPTYEVLSPGTDANDPGPVRGPIVWERGRVGDAPETGPTRITFALNDPEGEFSRRNAMSSRFGTLREGTPVRLAIDFGSGPVTIATAAVQRFAPVWDGEYQDGTTIGPRVPVDARGLLAAISRNTDVLSCARSVLGFFTVLSSTPGRSSYWPLETSLNSAVPGGPTLTGSAFLATSGPLGSDGAMDMSGAVTVAGPIASEGLTIWSFAFAVKMTAVTGAAVTIATLLVRGVTYATIQVDDTVGAELIINLSRDGAAGSTTFSAATIGDGEWHTLEVVLTAASGTTTSAIIKYDGANPSVAAQAVVFAEPDEFTIGGATQLTGLCQIAAPPGFYDDAVRLANAGEPAWSRFLTLLQSLGLTSAATFDLDATTELGRWQSATPMGTLRECEDAEDGVMYEGRTGRIVQEAISGRYNLDPALTLAWADINGAVPLDDDRDTYNVITATDPDGNFAVEQETNGPVGTDELGARPLPITRNIYDPDNLRHHAGWVLRKGTIDQPRYIVFLNLVANETTAAQWAATTIGSRIIITGTPTQHTGPDDLDLIVEGERGMVDGAEGWVELHCQPYPPYKVMVWAENSPPDLGDYMGRWASERHCAIRTAIDDDDAAVLIDPPIGRCTTTAADLNESNYDALYARAAGETMKVTAVATTACTVVAAGVADHDNNAAVTPADYAGGAANQWAFVAARTRGNATLAITDSNYTYQLVHRQGGLYVWDTVRGSSAPAPTITPSGGAAGDTITAVQFGFASMPITLTDLTDAIILATSKTNASDQDIDFSRLRAGTLPGRLILLVAGKSDDWTGVAPPAGFTELVDVSSTTGNDQGLYVAYRIDATPTAVTPGKLAVTGGAAAVSESMVLALGSGYQTLTVERSANGVVKSHAAGTAIETVDPLIWAL